VGSRRRPHLRRVAFAIIGQHERLKKVYQILIAKKTLLFTDGKLLF
jgi:hypothetical protein